MFAKIIVRKQILKKFYIFVSILTLKKQYRKIML